MRDIANPEFRPLGMAIFFNRVAIACLLITNDADVQIRDSDGNTYLHSAAYFGSYEIARILIQAGINIESVNKYKETPLYTAVKQLGDTRRTIDVVELLISKGADASRKNVNGYSPDYWMIKYGYIKLARKRHIRSTI